MMPSKPKTLAALPLLLIGTLALALVKQQHDISALRSTILRRALLAVLCTRWLRPATSEGDLNVLFQRVCCLALEAGARAGAASRAGAGAATTRCDDVCRRGDK